MNQAKTLDIILGGGKGSRLFPLTAVRTKPAVPLGRYRVADFVLSNISNSGGRNIYVLIEYKPDSLIDHIAKAWNQDNLQVNLVKPDHTYLGTADAVYQNIGLVEKIKPKIVNIFGGDHVYTMDVSQMNRFHLDNHADLTIAAIPVTIDEGRKFGVLEVNSKGEVIGFDEKPQNPKPIPGNAGYCLASMGIYNFNPRELVKFLGTDAKKIKPEGNDREVTAIVAANPQIYSMRDFGQSVIPAMREAGKRIYAYDFAQNKIVGSHPLPYWMDIGDLDVYHQVHRDMMGHDPRFRSDLPNWPIRTHTESDIQPRIHPSATVLDSLLAEGTELGARSTAEESSLSYGVQVGQRVVLTNSIVLPDAIIGRNSKLHRTIIDKGVNVPPGMEIGFYRDDDIARGFTISKGGITVVPKNYVFK